METRGLSFTEAVNELAISAGLRADESGCIRPRAMDIKRATQKAMNRDKQDKIAWVRKIWSECRPASDTLAETYLQGRFINTAQLPKSIPPTIRFHPRLSHTDTGLVFPAMVAAVQNGERRITGIHRTFLTPNGNGKTSVKNPKKMLGMVWGGAIQLAAP